MVTLSGKLSGSYNAACVGREMVLERSPEKKIHIFESESASAGETLIALMLRDRIEDVYKRQQLHRASRRCFQMQKSRSPPPGSFRPCRRWSWLWKPACAGANYWVFSQYLFQLGQNVSSFGMSQPDGSRQP